MHALSLPFGATADDFRWAVGIEDTFVPQTRSGLRSLDEYELMGHYASWREDLALARATGARMIRWGMPWYRVEPEAGRFDWSWTDQVIPYLVDELGLEPILDLVHYGTPLWLTHSFADPRYPEAVAAYARAVAERYGDRVRFYTPLNEPVVNAQMCGQRGIWPPYLRGERGFMQVGIALALGIVRTVQALKAVDPRFIMVHVEAGGITRAQRAELEPLANEQRLLRFLFYDLITGRVDTHHPLFSRLLAHGVSLHHLQWLRDHAVELDVVGLNFYPQWSTVRLEVDAAGRLRRRLVERCGVGFGDLIGDVYERYRAPIMITETSAKGSLAIKQRWLEASVATVRALRQAGIPVIGYTWFPLFTMVDWRYRTGRGPRNDYLLELGLYESRSAVDGGLCYVATPLVEQFRRFTQQPEHAVGDLVVAPVTAAHA
ncbi:family 1 glycosylhydrolase [Kallotenue papyrolyticum]|uniref:family 1 glycosylhydrolase n=1 Tax=Kallotenue papyrolyticum TaxID=1325125 RepID=UPI0004924355|nr:family 1 glycosylhydrolase [Kallotenue papyrolyticum]